jgi:hypothetical protein
MSFPQKLNLDKVIIAHITLNNRYWFTEANYKMKISPKRGTCKIKFFASYQGKNVLKKGVYTNK